MLDATQPRPGAAGVHAAADLPFDKKHLDDLLEAANIDILLVTSKHNIQYMLGGYRFFFFDQFDAIGITRYLPIIIYPKGRPDRAVYVGNAMEDSEAENGRFWCPTVETRSWGTLDATGLAIDHIRRIMPPNARIGVEFSFFPADAMDALRSGLSDCQIVDSHLPLERLRAVKTPDELALIREASDRVVEAMLTTFAHCCPGITKRDVTARLRQEELNRGLNFDYCLITAGSGPNRAPSDQVINSGDIISLDSGGRYGGYIGDLCRMGIAGRPDAELDDSLGWVEAVQQAARTPIRSGMLGKEIFAAVKDVLSSSPHSANTHFVAHGVGVIGHEAPRLSDRGPVTYPAYDANLPLQAGMVLSIETTLMHPRRGFIKLEDTVAVTETGWDAFGDKGRGWNCGDPPMMSPGPDQQQ
jgi:Xaa-Pro aminopeptidase